MSYRRSVPEPVHQCAEVRQFMSSQPTFSGVAPIGCNHSSAQIPPGRLMTTSTAMFAQVNVLITIHIDHRYCFTQRFSPTGFILNGPDSNCSRPILSARIQDKTCTFSSITGVQFCFSETKSRHQVSRFWFWDSRFENPIGDVEKRAPYLPQD
jgi:hypothetical protein